MEIVVIGRNTPSFQSAVSGLRAKQHQVTALVSMRQRHALESLKDHRTCDAVIALAGSFVETDQAFAEAFQAEFRNRLVMLKEDGEISIEEQLRSLSEVADDRRKKENAAEERAPTTTSTPRTHEQNRQWILDALFECDENFQSYVFVQLGRQLGRLSRPSSASTDENSPLTRLSKPLRQLPETTKIGQPPGSKAALLRKKLGEIHFEDARHFRLLSRLIQNKGKGEGGACLAAILGFKNKEEAGAVFRELRILATRQHPDLSTCFIAKRSYGYGLRFPAS